MTHEVVLLAEVHRQACEFLLARHRRGERQEDLCFALWRPSTGARRTTALVFELILPMEGEHDLHGNASFDGSYLSRVIRLARGNRAGVAFLHSHLTPGWQEMSDEDVAAERDRIAPPSRAVGYPAVGMTLGTDGAWSARVWNRERHRFRRSWCRKVRVVGSGGFRVTRHPCFGDDGGVVPEQRRTVSTWGSESQADLAGLTVGIVGVGSVGCQVAEALARLGVRRLVLIDADRVERHNLDRLLYAGRNDLGRRKVLLAAKHLKRHATASGFRVEALAGRIEQRDCFLRALDCDLLFAAVDRPLPKDVVNHLSFVHCIPVIFGGIYAANKANGKLGQASWSVVTVDPERRCLRCDGQYTTADITMERDGSLDRPDYLRNLRADGAVAQGGNVFPFSANLASFMVLEMIRLVIGEQWWPGGGNRMEFSFIPRRLSGGADRCAENCVVRSRVARGDQAPYPFLVAGGAVGSSWVARWWASLRDRFGVAVPWRRPS